MVCNVEFAKMSNIIKHQGTIENINGPYMKVRIVQTSACSSCSIKGHCNASESKEKIIDVYDMQSSTYKIGQNVMIYGTTSMGMQAVILAFGVPFIVLFFVLFVTIKLTGNELISAISAMLSLLPYYLIIFLFRNKLSKKFSFTVKPIIINN